MIKYMHRPLDADLHRQITANLAKLPKHQRWMGRTTPQCDFCAYPDPKWIYASDRTTAGELRQCLRWLACDDCHALITANNWGDLAKRSVKGMGAHGDRAEGVVRAVFMAFRTDAVEIKEEA